MFLIITIISFTIFSLSHCCINNESSIISTGISEKDIEYIVDIHNKLRANVALGNVENQQKAKNMRKMRWDDDLATLAQDWSDNCVFKHDYNMTDPQDRFQVGQNLAITKHTLLENEEPDFNFMFDLWADEKDNFNYSRLLESDVLRSGDNQILHYTQIVAARTYLIGCGYTLFKEDGFFPYGKLYVCNYGPIGNIYDTYPYEERNDDELLCDDVFEDSETYGLCEPKGTNSSSIIEVTEPEYYESTETNLIEKNGIILSEQNTETNSIETNSMTIDEQTSKSNFTEKNSTIVDEETEKNGNLI